MRIAIVVLLVTTWAGGAFAESAKDAQSREHFQRGQKLFEAADYDGALGEFQQSYALAQYPAILYKIALCQDQLGHTTEAIAAYKQYLAQDPQTSRRRGIEARLDKLQASAPPVAATPPPEPPPTAPAPPPAVVTPPTVAPQPQPLVAAPAPPPAEKHTTPIYKKWWLWTAVGVVVAGAAVAGAVAATTPRDASAPPGAIPVHFPSALVAQ